MSSPVVTRTHHGAAVAKLMLVGYLLFVGFTVWLPATVSAKVTGLVGIIAHWVADAGIASFQRSAFVLEILANVALFVPVGLLLLLAFPRLRVWQAVVVGGLMSLLIEGVQALMPTRIPAVSDLIANTSGTLIGALIVAVILALAGVRRASTR
ncbi:VanZ family protein [Microbacterium sp. 179-I 3D3 NHS]|uniref:VanZ family protein n=1 Tax=unclassified Microbacterium TaxID=2609290 RepID=UPI0039A08ACB